MCVYICRYICICAYIHAYIHASWILDILRWILFVFFHWIFCVGSWILDLVVVDPMYENMWVGSCIHIVCWFFLYSGSFTIAIWICILPLDLRVFCFCSNFGH